jgi:hypothetical protein
MIHDIKLNTQKQIDIYYTKGQNDFSNEHNLYFDIYRQLSDCNINIHEINTPTLF